MTETTDKVWAIDRKTEKPGQYHPDFLAAWPNGYLRIDPPTDLASLTVADLKAHADERGIDLSGAKKKTEILAAIEAHDPEPTVRSASTTPAEGGNQEGGA